MQRHQNCTLVLLQIITNLPQKKKNLLGIKGRAVQARYKLQLKKTILQSQKGK